MEFSAVVRSINTVWLVVLPQDVSNAFPSRGLCLANLRIGECSLKTVLEPDGRGSHWFRLGDAFLRNAGLLSDKLRSAGLSSAETVDVHIEPAEDWPEPTIPKDLAHALAVNSEAESLWKNISPRAHWDWIRWIRSTNNSETRSRRVVAAIDKLHKGEKRPCCFNRNLCSDPSVSKSGVLPKANSTAINVHSKK